MHLTTTKIPLSTPVLLLVAALPLVAIGVLLYGTTAPPWWFVVGLLTATALPIGLMAPARHWLEIRQDEVLLRYRPFRTRRIATRDVVRFELIEREHPARYWGAGLRLATGKRLGTGKVVAFINRPGPALLIRPVDGWSSLIVLASAEEGETVRRHLEQVTGRPVERRGT